MKKIEIGEKVKIVLYGHLRWESKSVFPEQSTPGPIYAETDHTRSIDTLPGIVGKEGVVKEFYNGQYRLDGISEKTAWYNREQLQLVSKKDKLSTDQK